MYEVLQWPIDTNMTKGKICHKVQLLYSFKYYRWNKNEEFEIYPDDFSKMVKRRLKDDKENLENGVLNSL